jgi:2-C-methyl-D-erythritol 4-phosphate cytidylyltransferase
MEGGSPECGEMATFSVLLLTASPPGHGEAGGAYLKIDGRESLLRAVEMFLNRDNVKQMQLVVPTATAEEAKRKYGANLGFSGVKLVAGGTKWIEQIQAGAKNISAECTHVIVHDAARPAVPYSDIESAMAAAESSDAVVLAAPIRTTLLEIDEGSSGLAYHLPSQFVQLQTPQIYSLKVLEQIAQSGKEPHASALKIVKGSPLNVRLATGADASFVRAMLNMLPKPKTRAASNPFDEAQW